MFFLDVNALILNVTTCHASILFAIFLLIPGYSWESFPEYFRNSPFITINNLIVSPHKQV